MAEIDPFELVRKRHNLKNFPPPTPEFYSPQTHERELWFIDRDTAEIISDEATQQRCSAGWIVSDAIREYFRVPNMVESDYPPVLVDSHHTFLSMDNRDIFTQLLKSVASAHGNTTHLALMDDVLSHHLGMTEDINLSPEENSASLIDIRSRRYI